MDVEFSNSILFTTTRPPIVMSKGEGMWIWDVEQNKYLDFIGGWAVNSLGHSPPELINALTKQAKQLINGSPSFYNQEMLFFANELTEVSCFDRVFFASSGAEANESAIKLARKYGQLKKKEAYEIITMEGGFHGRTLATMSASGKPAFKPLFEPKVSGFKHVPLNDIDALKSAITPQTCAVMIEPIQGEGGVHEASLGYMQDLRELCSKERILLIFDEVQTGFGRTGSLFAYEQFSIEPDIMTLGKGIASGFPLSAMLCKEELNIFEPGDQGGTYTGQPLGMACGRTVLKTLLKPGFLSHVEEMACYLREALVTLQPWVKPDSIRGRGLLIAFECPGYEACNLVQKARDYGVIINAVGKHTIRLMPPLIADQNHIDFLIQVMKLILKKGA